MLPEKQSGITSFTYEPAQVQEHHSRFAKIAAVTALALCTLLAAPWDRLVFGSRAQQALVAPPLGFPGRIQRQWGQYSPYFPAGHYVPPPPNCEITQANILQRHGARYPDDDDHYDKAVTHLLRAHKYLDPSLDFLNEYHYALKTAMLVPYGAEQSFEAGEAAYRRYGHLVSEHNIPFVRASGIPRVVSTAGNWTVGFAAASNHHINPNIDVILSESFNSTLNNHCPAASDGSAERDAWLDVFAPPIVSRLRTLAPGAPVTKQDIHRLLALCPFETVAFERPSPFCGLFSDEEFRAMEYYGDLEKYYKTGYGNPLGRIQGVGYLNELIARLTGRPVHDKTTHNATLPFPLGRALYADFTHENLIVAVFSAMGLYNSSSPSSHVRMDPREMDENREWVASRMVPFSARLVVERLACDMPGPDDDEGEEGEYVRVFVNDELRDMSFCMEEKGYEGMCELGQFVESQVYARESGYGDFERCFE